jgi:hypothetical protein
MNDSFVFLALIMLFVGPIQLVWAMIHSILTTDPVRELHYRNYFAGVGHYFVVLYFWIVLGGLTSHELFFTIAAIHFFASAIGLACYHIYINSMDPHKPKSTENHLLT